MRIIDGRVITEAIIDDAVVHDKMADSAIDTAEIIDDAVTRPKLADSVIGSAEIINGEVTDSKLDSLFQMDRLVAIDTPLAWVGFPIAYGNTPVVNTTPGPDVTYARVTNVVPESFSWQADAAGSASWMAWGHR